MIRPFKKLLETSRALLRVGRHKRPLPRVSSARGGPSPGMELADFSALEEMDDLEYMAHMEQMK
jgi:hypothetical protein